ncbi:MAG TPA: hypothetical protein VF240_21035 [Pyrinomonadaceae bacterium]
MSRSRKIILVLFIVSSIFGMWARYSYQQAEKRKREELFRRLSMHNTLGTEAAPSAEPVVAETRDMFDSTLPQESLEQIKQAVGQDFRLLEVWFHEKGVFAKVSTDGQSVKEYRRSTNKKEIDGPLEVRLTGDGKLEDNLLKLSDVDLSLIPKLAKEAKERAALPDSKASSAGFKLPFIRYEGEGPEWSVMVETGKPGENWQSKHVTFDAKGKFKKVF